jgi:hypothetical protein
MRNSIRRSGGIFAFSASSVVLSELLPGALDSVWLEPEMSPLTKIRYAAEHFNSLVPQGTFSSCIDFSTASIVAYSAPKVARVDNPKGASADEVSRATSSG